MTFVELEDIRNHLSGLRRDLVASMRHYREAGRRGFRHQISVNDPSLASTATCVAALVAGGEWRKMDMSARDVASTLIGKVESAGLPPYNPFSLAFVAEGVLDLCDAENVADYPEREEHRKRVREEIAARLRGYILKKGTDAANWGQELGAIAIPPYPSSAYLTQLAYRVVRRCREGDCVDQVDEAVRDWSRNEVNKQIALITAGSRNGDAMQLLYALILAVTTTSPGQASPEDKEIFSHALALFFSKQAHDGSWPLSRPMFHYAKVGNAYCFEYEALTQLLECQPLRDDLLAYVPSLQKAARLLDRTAFNVGSADDDRCPAWASGHHPQIAGPESWSTAAVYHFVHAFDRLIAEAIRRTLFSNLRAVYPGAPLGPRRTGSEDAKDLAPDFLDARVHHPDSVRESLLETLAQRFVFPLAHEAAQVEKGGKFGGDTPMSAILFGPPGTSKTELAKIIAGHLRWPLLQVDPSYLVQEGLDRVQAMANGLFSMLVASEQIVVLLDEFDEVGRDRAGNENLLSRFITTAMLPKLADINKQRRIVFLLATNYVSGFDAAFRRGGRFDMALQVMQPTLEAKLANPKWGGSLKKALGLIDALESMTEERRKRERGRIADLTFLETKDLVRKLEGKEDGYAVLATIAEAWRSCTLEKPNEVQPHPTVPMVSAMDAQDADDAGTPHPAEPIASDPGRKPPAPATGRALPDEPETAEKGQTWRKTSEDERKEMRIPPARSGGQ